MAELRLQNTLSGEKEMFSPVDPNHVRVYACGPTVYNYAHIGNARMAVVFDLLVRVLKTIYPKVTYVSNITDVDDKIIAASHETGQAIDDITEKYGRIYNEDMGALGVALPDIQPRATAHIQDMIYLIDALIKQDHAYEAEGHVMFNVPSFPAYGGLSRRNRDDMVAGARVEVAPYKRDAADFVLWKPSTEDQPGWDSPWGFGRPGWHIECSAMAEKHLGLPFDIHGGGADLKFPHHENEIAQSCCAHGETENLAAFAKYWVHNGFVTVKGEKMAKSVGNITLVHDLLNKYDGEVLRLTLLSAHYRQPLDWSEQTIEQNKNYLDRLYRVLDDLSDVDHEKAGKDNADLMMALCDDLNTPKALSVLSALAREAQDKKTSEAKGALIKAGHLLGILQRDPQSWLGFDEKDDDIDRLLREREEARKSKDFARADEIRDELDARGVVIEDTPEGPKWRKVS